MSNLLVAPLEALTDPLLSDPERRVLLSLFSFRGRDTNVVWPSTESLAERANINDKTWISKITKSLCEKGWLEKKKRGFSGGNQYTLHVPDRLILEESKLDQDSKLDGEPKIEANPHECSLAKDAASNLDGEPKLDGDTFSKLDGEPKCNEQTNEQTNIKKITKKSSGLKTMKTWLHDLKQIGESPVPEDDPVFEYAEEAGLPIEYLRMAWVEFREGYLHTDKKYKNWRAVFIRSVRGNWKKLWWHDGSGYALTALGQQAMTAMHSRDKKAAA